MRFISENLGEVKGLSFFSFHIGLFFYYGLSMGIRSG
jgi:hypothetical protein